MKIKCVILCGGRSSRMGTNKALLPFGKSNLLAFLIEKYKAIFQDVYVCCKESQNYQNLEAKILLEESPIYAPMIGLKKALEVLGENLFFVCVDYPFLQKEHCLKIYESFSQNEICYAKTTHRSHFLIGIYSPSILPKLSNQIQREDFKMSSFILTCQSSAVEFDDEESFVNLNTQEDYFQILRNRNGK